MAKNKKKEKLKLSEDESWDIIGENHDEYITLIEDILYHDTEKCFTNRRSVVQRMTDGKFFEIYYSIGTCGNSWFKGNKTPKFVEVFAKTKATVIYE